MNAATARKSAKMSRTAFRAFVETRPDEERWELIGGVAMMMNPPTKAHQRIASNLQALLNDAQEKSDPTKVAYQRIGVTIESVPDYDPEPDVVIVDQDATDDRYAARFYLAAEIVSSSDARTIDGKRAVYRLPPSCGHLLIVEQSRAEVTIEERTPGGWGLRRVSGLDGRLELPEWGFSCTLAEIYRRTSVA